MLYDPLQTKHYVWFPPAVYERIKDIVHRIVTERLAGLVDRIERLEEKQ